MRLNEEAKLRAKEELDRFGDLVYEAWRSGRNSDLVSEDRYDQMLDEGFYPDEIELKHIYPTKRGEEDG